MRSLALIGLFVVPVMLAAACGGPKDRTGARLELADAKLVVEQADALVHVLELSKDGAVEFDNELLLTLERNGHILIGGKRVARVERDGSISANTVRTNATVKDDGTFVLDGVDELTIAGDGSVTGPLFETMDHPRLKLEGAKVRYEGPPGARRATMVGLAAFLTNLPSAVAEK